MIDIIKTIECDECGRKMSKAKRVYKKIRYCDTCYKRIFKRRMCPKCGNYRRLPKFDLKAICKKCEIDKPCIRCGKPQYKTGKITPYGPVCKSCSPYFREPAPCSFCGRPSTRLTRVKRTNIEVPVCPKCACQDYGTCQACRRHRLLQEAPGGKLLCKKCLNEGEIPCPSCGNLMPAGMGKMCSDCSWKNTFHKRLKINLAVFAVPEMVQVFNRFGEWLLNNVGSHKAALRIHRYLPFFIEIEKRWQRVPEYCDLLACFGAEYLRRVRLPIRWLKEEYSMMIDITAKEEDSNARHILTILATVPKDTLAAKALERYRIMLTERFNTQKTTLRSIRLGLHPAASLLVIADNKGQKLPNQRVLDQYLHAKPGQKAAVTGFINYLNKFYKLNLFIQMDSKQIVRIRRKKLEMELISLLSSVNESAAFQRKWISNSLSYFHQLPRIATNKLKIEETCLHEKDGFIISWKEQKYWIPKWNSPI